MNTLPSDDAILTLFFERDEKAIAAFEQKYKSLCLKLAQDITGSAAAAEECLNDLYLRLWNTIPPQCPASLKSFACRIIRNLALQYLEREQAQKRSAVIVELDECDAGAVCESEGEIMAMIDEWLATLSERDAMIFVRRYFYSEPVGEIAARLKIRENQVSKILHRLRKALRATLEKGGITV